MKQNRDQLFWGIVLMAVGTFLFINQVFDIEWGNLGLLFLPALGGVFLLAGIVKREAGFIIPGSIISGIGWGSLFVGGPFAFLSGDNEGGLFLLVFGCGFALITLLTALFTKETHWWALIPGGIIGLVGMGVLFGGAFMAAVTWLSKLWPLILIVIGVMVLLGAGRDKKTADA